MEARSLPSPTLLSTRATGSHDFSAEILTEAWYDYHP